jgi:eukaryotic-like serine/threonine-protein kinase
MSSRYTILGHLAKGGMASVYLGRMSGSAGFSRLVAIKRLHPELATDRELIGMLVDEARIATRIRHTNVIDTLDLVVSDGAFSLVLEYVEGDSLSALVKTAKKAGETIPQDIALAIIHGVLRGLDAAHEARGTDGHPLGIVHRDVSPQNVLVGVDGVPRVIDFGIAKAIGKLEQTKPGEVRGKFSYMAPEQLMAKPITRQVDVYAAGVMLWELLTGERLFTAEDERAVCAAVLRGAIAAPSKVNPDVSSELDQIVLRATALDVGERYLTAREVITDLEKHPRASDEEVAAWVRRLTIEKRAQRQRMIEGDASVTDLRSIDEVMKELAVAPEPPSASSLEIAKPVAMPVTPQAKTRSGKMPLVAIGAGAIVALVAIVVVLARPSSHAPPKDPGTTNAAPAPSTPAPTIVVSSLIVESAAVAQSASAPASAAVSKPPVRKVTPKAAASVDPASFQ